MSVFNDTLFLSNLEIIDYSLIVGLDKKTQKLVVGIIGQTHRSTQAGPKWTGERTRGRGGSRRSIRMSRCGRTRPLMALVGLFSHCACVCVWLDYVRVYTWDKKLEMGVKSVGLIAGQNMPTIISPQNYKIRFRLAMERYFMVSPEPSSKLSLLTTAPTAAEVAEAAKMQK